MPNVLILGLARDCATKISKNIESLALLFHNQKIHWVVLESNSSDDTLLRLHEERESRANFYVLDEPQDIELFQSRTGRMACRRNALLNFGRDLNLDDVIAVTIVDLDNDIEITSDSSDVLRLLSLGHVVCAHQTPVYYDIYALRYLNLTVDYSKEVALRISSGENPFLVYLQTLLAHQRAVGSARTDILVESAFGGLAIYPKAHILRCQYEDDGECEHVSLNLQLTNLVSHFVISPKLQIKRVREHTLYATGFRYLAFSILARFPRRLASRIFSAVSQATRYR